MTRRARALMVQGTGSDVGKSLMVAGLARAARRRGIAVAPFKPQNMSNNAAVTADGGEIGRAQALQARAAGLAPSVHMNPVLIKPQSDSDAQVVVQGRVAGNVAAAAYQELKKGLMAAVLDSFGRLAAEADLVLVEGAGSPAEINLRAGDIANMGFAEAADVPVVLVGDIDRGGVIASLVGTHLLLAEAERARLVGFIVNKFRGDVRLFDGGLAAIEKMTGLASFGVVPWFREAARLPPEDAVAAEHLARTARAAGGVRVAVPLLSRVANLDDFDPLAAEADVALEFVPPGRPLPGDADLVVLPGTKATLADLAFVRAQGWDVDLFAHVRGGGRVIGICGGYQMLGRTIADPEGIEGPPGAAPGLGLLDVETVMTGSKVLVEARGREAATGLAVAGYEIHVGRTTGPGTARPFLMLDGGPDGPRPDGAVSPDGRIMGAYLHNLFHADAFRADLRRRLGATGVGLADFDASVDAVLDRLADHLETHLRMDALLAAAR
jgi:adenosylcobyric acid synthase